MSTKGNDEPNTAPHPDRWYSLTLGSSFKDHPQPSSKFCTLRYEFKPASIDKTQPGTLHKNKENRVTVEFQNNQLGKPKVTFEGSSEDYKENDAVLFFDGQEFRLERLHRSFKRLRHIRLPGESNASAATSSAAVADASSPPLARSGAKGQNLAKSTFNPVPVEVERIDIGNTGNSAANRHDIEKVVETLPPNPIPSMASPDDMNFDLEEQLDIVDDDDIPQKEVVTGIDINNMPHQMDTDDEIADVDVNEDDLNTGRNAAEALRAQVNAEGKEEQTSSSSGSSGSENSGSSSGSGSGSSSSSDNESSDGDTVNSI